MNPKTFRAVVLVLLALVQLTVAEAPKQSERDGSTKEKAIIITAESDFAGVRAKHLYIFQHYPGCHLVASALVRDRGRSYDIDTFTTANGEKKSLWFDITQNFGKW